MSDFINKPEKGNQPGVYEIENVHGEKVRLVAENFPQADAYVRMNATFVEDLQTYKAKELKKRQAAVKTETDTVASGKEKGK